MSLPTLQAERKTKYENTTMCISNSGLSDKMKVILKNKARSKPKG